MKPTTKKIAAIYAAVMLCAVLMCTNSIVCAFVAAVTLCFTLAYCAKNKQTAKALYKSVLKLEEKLSNL